MGPRDEGAGAPEMFLVGRGIEHSLSPAMWNHLSKAIGWSVSYGLRDSDESGLGPVLAEITGGGVLAANVTMPYKAWAAAQAEVATDGVSDTGAANFLQLRDGKLFADNTDVVGARRLLEAVDRSEQAVVLGAGGTAAALLVALAGRAHRVAIVNRSPDRARALAKRHAHRFAAIDPVPWDRREAAAKEADLIVNTVPLVETSPVSLSHRTSPVRVYDAIYRRSPTPFQREAVDGGFPLCDGLTHLAAQAIAMLSHLGLEEEHGRWLVDGLESATDRTVTAWGEPLNPSGRADTVWLVGMMGSGKTTVGRRLAAGLGLDFEDTDALVEVAAGCSISELWDRSGEERFRQLEHEAVVRVAGRRAVVSTGGGAVLRDDNVSVMRRTGRVAWLDASESVLVRRVGSGAGRPLLAEGAGPDRIAEVLADRRERYRAAAHRTFDGGRPPSQVVEEIEQWIGS